MNRDILLVSEDYIKTYTPVTENLDGDYITSAVFLVQDMELETTIGTSLTNKIYELVDSGEISNTENKPYKALLDGYIQPMVANYTIVHLIQNTAIKMTNFGVMKSEDEKMVNVSKEEVKQAQDYYTHIGDYYKKNLQNYLITNSATYPELNENNTVDKIKKNLYSAASSNIWLGGERGKIIN